MRSSTDSTPSLEALLNVPPSQSDELIGFFSVSKLSTTPPPAARMHRDPRDDVFLAAMISAAARASTESSPDEAGDIDERGEGATCLESLGKLGGFGAPVVAPVPLRHRRRAVVWLGGGFTAAVLVLAGFVLSAGAAVVPPSGVGGRLSSISGSIAPFITEEVVYVDSVDALPSDDAALAAEPESVSVIELEETLIEAPVAASPIEPMTFENALQQVTEPSASSEQPAASAETEGASTMPESEAPHARPVAPARETDPSLMVMSLIEPADEPQAEPQLPRTLTRPQVVTGMSQVLPRLRTCTTVEHSQVVVNVTIDGETGGVSRAMVTGPLSATATGNCIERSLRQARFPRFSDDSLNVRSYPIRLRAPGNR